VSTDVQGWRGKRKERKKNKKKRGEAERGAMESGEEKVIKKKEKKERGRERKEEEKAIALSRKSAFRGCVLGARDDVSQDGRPARSSSSLRACTVTFARRNYTEKDFEQMNGQKVDDRRRIEERESLKRGREREREVRLFLR